MPIMRPQHYDAGAKSLDRIGDPFVAGVVKPPAMIRAGLGMTAPKTPRLMTFKAPGVRK